MSKENTVNNNTNQPGTAKDLLQNKTTEDKSNPIKFTGNLINRYREINNKTNEYRTILVGQGEFDLGDGKKFTLIGEAAIARRNNGTTTIELGIGGVLSFGTYPKFTINGSGSVNLSTGNITLKAGASMTIGDVTITGNITYNTLKGTITNQSGVTYKVNEWLKLEGTFGDTDGNAVGFVVKTNRKGILPHEVTVGVNLTNGNPYFGARWNLGKDMKLDFIKNGAGTGDVQVRFSTPTPF